MPRTLTLALLASLPLLAADQIVLTNGDTITGIIVKKDGAKLTVKSDLLGEVSMPWSAVKSVRGDSEVFVQLPSGEVVKGKVATSGDQLEVATHAGTKTAPMAQVAAVRDAGEQRNYERLLHPGLLDLWTSNFDMGLALARGNARTDTLTTTFNANRTTRSDKVTVYFKQARGTARVDNVTSLTVSAIRAGWKYDRNLTPRFFVT